MSAYGYDCLRRHRARTRRRFYNPIVMRVVNFGIRWLARVCFFADCFLRLAIATGWTTVTGSDGLAL